MVYLRIVLNEYTSMNTENINQHFRGESYFGKTLANYSFLDCAFFNCNFSEAVLDSTRFCSCTFKNCNLSLVKIAGVRFQDVQFIDSKIVGGEFFKCDPRFFSVHFKNCILQYCNFSDLNMKNAKILESKLMECYFTNTCLAAAEFSKTDLAGTVFHNCDLSKADFSSTRNYAIDPQVNVIKKAKFSLPEAITLLQIFDIHLVD